jgi:hypothetical protein
MKNGNGTGYRSQDKVVVAPGRFKNDPAFARARENASEFAKIGSAGKLIRNSVNSLLQDIKDNTRSRRMFSMLREVIKSDHVSDRGMRNFIDGDLTLLKGFPLNGNAKLTDVFAVEVSTEIDRVTGHLTITIPSYLPFKTVIAPPTTTHYQFVSAGAEIDFALTTFKTDIKQSAELPIDKTATAALTITHTVTANSTLPLFLVMGIKFYQQVNGIMYPIVAGNINPLMILDVKKV